MKTLAPLVVVFVAACGDTNLIDTLIADEPAGANCPYGGLRVQAEDETRYVCNGAPGADGAAGADGQNGAQGPAGQNGAPGTNGTNGTDGEDGEDGTDGQDGSNGAPGPQGPQGPAGTNAPIPGMGVCPDGLTAVMNGANRLFAAFETNLQGKLVGSATDPAGTKDQNVVVAVCYSVARTDTAFESSPYVVVLPIDIDLPQLLNVPVRNDATDITIKEFVRQGTADTLRSTLTLEDATFATSELIVAEDPSAPGTLKRFLRLALMPRTVTLQMQSTVTRTDMIYSAAQLTGQCGAESAGAGPLAAFFSSTKLEGRGTRYPRDI